MKTLTKEYTQLFNTITEAQRQAEELFLEAEQEAPAEKGA